MNFNQVKITEDLFNHSIKIDWEYVAGRIPKKYEFNFEDGIVTGAENENFSKFIFSPVNIDGRNYLKTRFQKKHFNTKKGDSISFLFSDEKIEIFIIDNDPTEIMNHPNWGIILEINIPLTISQIDKFINYNFLSWKFKSGNKELFFKDGIASDSFRPLVNLQNSITKLFQNFKDILTEEKINIIDFKTITNKSSCYVYLMKDLSNGSYKIGISNSPKYREKTLQSQKPEIELIHAKQFHKRKIAEIFEKVLHEIFRNKRIRGEWFELSNEDIEDLKQVLK